MKIPEDQNETAHLTSHRGAGGGLKPGVRCQVSGDGAAAAVVLWAAPLGATSLVKQCCGGKQTEAEQSRRRSRHMVKTRRSGPPGRPALRLANPPHILRAAQTTGVRFNASGLFCDFLCSPDIMFALLSS